MDLGNWAASLLSGSWMAHSERPGGHWERRNVSFSQVLNTKYGAGVGHRADTLPLWLEFSLAPRYLAFQWQQPPEEPSLAAPIAALWLSPHRF